MCKAYMLYNYFHHEKKRWPADATSIPGMSDTICRLWGSHFLYYFLYKKQNTSVSMIGRLLACSDINWDNRF